MSEREETLTLSAKHTPGPWVVDNCGRDVCAGGVGGLFVARIYAIPEEDNPSGYGDQQLANARLMAAAPDMEDALRFIAENSGDPVMENVARAALAKAVPPSQETP